MIVQILVSILIISEVTALGLKSGIDWQKNRGNGLGKHYMEEYGLRDDKDDEL